MLADFTFKTSAPLLESEHDYLMDLGCWYRKESQTYRIAITEDIDERADLEKISMFFRENFSGENENLLMTKLCEKCLLATATVPHGNYLTRRIYLTAELMGFLSRYEIDFDYEVVPSSDSCEEE